MSNIIFSRTKFKARVWGHVLGMMEGTCRYVQCTLHNVLLLAREKGQTHYCQPLNNYWRQTRKSGDEEARTNQLLPNQKPKLE
jgi:hypothetical protein